MIKKKSLMPGNQSLLVGRMLSGSKNASAIALCSVLLVTGCSSSSDSDNNGNGITEPAIEGSFTALVATRADDYSSGQLEQFVLNDGEVTAAQFASGSSDIAANTDGSAYYQLARFGFDSITRYEASDLINPVYQWSVAGDDASANPYQIVFVSDTKAYVIRYGSGKIWVVNPSAETEDGFKTGEIDISAHDVDGIPEASQGVLVGDRLYVLMERLENFAPVKNGRIAVIDTTSDSETDAVIDLNVANPTALQYSEVDGMLYVLGRGNFFAMDDSAGDRYSGGVDLIDPEAGTASLLLDDGTEGEGNNQGFFFTLQVVSASKAYVATLAGFGNTTLRELNPVTGMLTEGAVDNLEGINITTLALDPVGQLWVGIGDAMAPGFRVFDPMAETVSRAFLASTLLPLNVVFTP